MVAQASRANLTHPLSPNVNPESENFVFMCSGVWAEDTERIVRLPGSAPLQALTSSRTSGPKDLL
eukprot:6472113-Amphidinium_carterae.1